MADPRAQYEQILPPRGVSRRPEPFDDSALLYRPTSPTYPAPRRVITQPEYVYRDPTGQGNPMPPPPGGEYLPSRPELPREYITRPASARPPLDQQYDMLPTYERVHVDDRQPPPRDYYRAASARPTDGSRLYELPVAYERRLAPDDQQQAQYPPQRPASVRPAAAEAATQVRYDLPPREYAARRVEYATTTTPSSAAMYHLPPQPQQSPGGRAYSAVPGGAGAAVASGAGGQGERYYGRAMPPSQQQQEEEVVFLERPPQYR